MKLSTIAIIVGVIILLCIVWTPRGTNDVDKYRFLGGLTNPALGGYHAEANEDCLQFPGVRQCMLTDGTSGTCVQSGLCVPNMLVDLNMENKELKKPYCTMPTFKENCELFCKCKALEGDDDPQCIEGCRSWFSPL